MAETENRNQHCPKQVVHADWSGREAKKRRMARAVLCDGAYHLGAPIEVADPGRLLESILDEVAPRETVVLGFDFPIGLPRTYAEKAGVRAFRAFFAELAAGDHRDFWEPAMRREDISVARPFFPGGRTKGKLKRDLATALGVATVDDLLRQCERGNDSRGSAECMFWLVGAKQVGRAALHGWQFMLLPGLRALGERVRFWPFDGNLGTLIEPDRLVVVETYPAEYYEMLGVNAVIATAPGDARGKRHPEARRLAGSALVDWAERHNVVCSAELCGRLHDGFGSEPSGEDDFDAVVGLLGMVGVIQGCRVPGVPEDDALVQVEGWIFGHESAPAY